MPEGGEALEQDALQREIDGEVSQLQERTRNIRGRVPFGAWGPFGCGIFALPAVLLMLGMVAAGAAPAPRRVRPSRELVLPRCPWLGRMSAVGFVTGLLTAAGRWCCSSSTQSSTRS